MRKIQWTLAEIFVLFRHMGYESTLGKLSLRLTGTPIIHNDNPPDWKWNSSARQHFNLWILISGRGQMSIDHNEYEIQPGFAVLLDRQQVVRARNVGGGPISNIGLHFTLEEKPDPILGDVLGKTTRLLHLPLIVELSRYLEEGNNGRRLRSPQEQSELATQILRIYVADYRLGAEDPIDRVLWDQYQQIRMNPGRDWMIPPLAEEMGLSVSQYERRFRKVTGETPLSCVIRSRIENACSLLLNSSLRIGEISELLGYRDIGYFSRQFRKKTGLSPLDYRKKD